MDVRRENCHFIDPEYFELPCHGQCIQLEKAEKEEQFVGSLDIDNFEHRLQLAEHLRTFFELPPRYTEEDNERW